MKIVKIILAILLIVFAALQYNDPDPWLWVFIYGLAALLIIIDISGGYMRRYYRIAIVALALFSLIYIPGVITYFTEASPGELVESMQADKPYIEETREFFGLVLIIIIYAFLYSKNEKSADH
ncbi:MAG: transmembrane 220 family protein [Candidatus Cyclobacteriaceae bacterium M2_1C_046]